MISIKWQSIDTRRDYFLSCIMYNCIHGKVTVRLCNEVEMVFDRHGFKTLLDNMLNVVLPKPNLECFKNCFRYAGGKIWNSLPSAFQNAKYIDVFKRMYKDNFFKLVWYNADSFTALEMAYFSLSLLLSPFLSPSSLLYFLPVSLYLFSSSNLFGDILMPFIKVDTLRQSQILR